MSKQKNQNMHKLVVLSMLLQENLDELNPQTRHMKEYRETLIKFTEELNNEIKDTPTVLRTTYFQDLCNKVDTVIRNNFDQSK